MRFSRKDKEEFNNSLKELLVGNSFKNINKRDKKGRTILHYAVGISNQKTVRLLIEKGVDVNAADVGGYTPLHLAVTAKQLENVKELIRSGAEVNATEYGSKNTPLHLGCMVEEVGIVEELVKAGAEIDQPDELGKTAMYYARNNKEIMEVLKKKIREMEKLLEKLKRLSERTVDAIFSLNVKEKGEKRFEEIREKLEEAPLVKKALLEVEKELDEMDEKIKGL